MDPASGTVAALASGGISSGLNILGQRSQAAAAEATARNEARAHGIRAAQIRQSAGAAKQTIALQLSKLSGELSTAASAAYIDADSVTALDRQQAALSQARIDADRETTSALNALTESFTAAQARISQLRPAMSVNPLEALSAGLQMGATVYGLQGANV